MSIERPVTPHFFCGTPDFFAQIDREKERARLEKIALFPPQASLFSRCTEKISSIAKRIFSLISRAFQSTLITLHLRTKAPEPVSIAVSVPEEPPRIPSVLEEAKATGDTFSQNAIDALSCIQVEKNLNRLALRFSSNLSNTDFRQILPYIIKHLPNLTGLDLYGSTHITEIPESITDLRHLQTLCITTKSNSLLFPEQMENLRSLTHLVLTYENEAPRGLQHLQSLTDLTLNREQPAHFPEGVTELPNLTRLCLQNFPIDQNLIPEALVNKPGLTIYTH